MYKARALIIIATVFALAACPLPFQFTPEDSDGAVSASNDPANPSMTAPPTLTIQESTSGEPVDSEPNTITARKNVTVGFQSETRGATIFYTTDGSRPVPGQDGTTRFSSDSPIVYNADGEGATINAIAIGPSMYPSPVTERVVAVDYDRVEPPAFSPSPGNFSTDQTVTISTTTSGATIYYTMVDGTDGAPDPQPGQAGTTEYTGPIQITGSGTAKSIAAVAVRSEMKDSTVARAVYTIGYDAAEAPSFSVPSGSYSSSFDVTLSTSTPGATIYYTTDGSTPTADSTVYASAISVFQTTTINAITIAAGFVDSTVSSATYTLPFHPYYDADHTTIASYLSEMSSSPIPNNRITLGPGDRLFLQTNEGNMAKMRIQENTQNANLIFLRFEYVVYDSGDGSIVAQGSSFVHGRASSATNQSFDLELGKRWNQWDNSTAEFFLTDYAPPAGSPPDGHPALSLVPSNGSRVIAFPEYDDIGRAEIEALESRMSHERIAKNSSLEGTIILYRTTEGNLGKMVITSPTSTDSPFDFRFTTYDSSGTVIASNDSATVTYDSVFNMDPSSVYGNEGVDGEGESPDTWDFYNNSNTEDPQGGFIHPGHPSNDAPMVVVGVDPTP